MATGTMFFSYTFAYDPVASTIGNSNIDSTLTDLTPDGTATLNSELVGWDLMTNCVIQSYDETTGDVIIMNQGSIYLLTNQTIYNSGDPLPTLSNTSGIYPYCFLTGTQIATPNGEVAVEALQVGDEILTHNESLRQAQGTAKVRFNFV